MPGMKWSAPEVVASIGTRVTADQLVPVVEVAITMSLPGQPDRNRQSCQTTYTLPAASISADGRPSPSRRPPFTPCELTLATVAAEPQLVPPFVETKARIEEPLA